jgi:putative intracellular protease/amidase
MTHRILLAVTSHAELGSTGKPTGAFLTEIAHPYAVFEKAGYTVDFVSPKGGRVPLDGMDDKDLDDTGRAFLADEAAMARLHASAKSNTVKADDYAGIFFAGGHGTMWDFPDDAGLSSVAGKIYDRGGVVAAVCHGPAGLLNVKLASGAYLVADKKVAAFTNEEEKAVELTEVVPFLLADKLAERGAKLVPATNWQANVVVTERLVTGQNPQSATGTAEAMVAEIKKAR